MYMYDGRNMHTYIHTHQEFDGASPYLRDDHDSPNADHLTSSHHVDEVHADHHNSRRDPYSSVFYKDDLTNPSARRVVAGSPVATVRNLR